MRSIRTSFLVGLTVLLAACGSTGVAGWRGSDIHLVDGTWIGTESPCGEGDDALVCRTIVERTKAALPPDVRANVTKAVLAALPTEFVNANGETLTTSLTGGIATREAVVVDLGDGSRRVIGLWCYLPSSSSGVFEARIATCDIQPLEFWRDGNAPPTIPPGWIPPS